MMDACCSMSVSTWILIAVVVILAYYRYYSWHYGIFKRLGIPGPTPIPLLGTMLPMMKEGVEASVTNMKTYGKVIGAFQGPTPLLMIHDTDILKKILVTEFSNFTNRFNPGISDYPLAKLITAVKDEHWKHIRSHLTPTFSSGKLRKMNAKMLQSIETLYGNLEKSMIKDEVFEFRALCGAFTMDVIASTAFGVKVDSHNDPNNQFVRMAKKAIEMSFASFNAILFLFLPFLVKPLSSLGLMSLFPKDAITFFVSVIDRAISERQNLDSESTDVDFLQLMVNAHVDDDEYKKKTEEEKSSSEKATWTKSKGLSHEEILAQSILFFLAGYDATANTLALFGYELACHPDIQDRLIEEIDRVMKDEKQVTYDLVHASSMPYLDMCISEVLRLYPSGFRTDRVTRNETTINGVRIPKGMTIGISIYALQRDPDVWPDPNKFDPERFTPEAKAARDPFYYLPFGIGPRNCVGMRLALMELKMAMVYLLQRLKFVVCEETEIPLELQKLRMAAVKGIKLKVMKR